MTRFLLADIPVTAQQSLESLHCWSGCTLAYLYPDVQAVEALDINGSNINVRCITSNAFFNTSVKPTEWRYISRFSAQILPDFTAGGAKWSYIQNLGELVIPDYFKK